MTKKNFNETVNVIASIASAKCVNDRQLGKSSIVVSMVSLMKMQMLCTKYTMASM